MNDKGQIMVELLLYLIVIMIILSLVIYAIDVVNDNQATRINNNQLNSILEDTMNTLVKTSGTPYNWEKLSVNDVKTIGLKSNNNNQLNYNKLIKLKNNNNLLDVLIPKGIDYSLTLYAKNNQNNKLLIAGTDYLQNRKQIQSKTVTTLIDYDYEITSFKEKEDKCPYNHDEKWVCKVFTIDTAMLDSGNYYIVTDNEINYELSNTYSQNITGKTSKILNINNQLRKLLVNENQTIFIHINDNNTYLVYDKNNREEYLNQVIKPQVYVLELKIAR